MKKAFAALVLAVALVGCSEGDSSAPKPPSPPETTITEETGWVDVGDSDMRYRVIQINGIGCIESDNTWTNTDSRSLSCNWERKYG